ncbi:MAG: winged helix-turn-helix transcriptional regulator [Deltaproteobacteria bacterium]|nr:winged helix-turn-helix transcriptional regulator [Deltaproteobacteria bacterium]MBK9649310.1 winged helix-turn-helix transcriptional regulator [Deltaproteobacteria bacterium]
MNEVSVDKTNQEPLRQAPVDLNPASCCAAAPAAFTAQPEDDERLAALCKALAHPHRVHILRFLLAQRACFAGEIAEQLPVAASTVSQHLTQLRDAGLIKGEVDGPRRCYCVAPEALAQLKQLVAAL